MVDTTTATTKLPIIQPSPTPRSHPPSALGWPYLQALGRIEYLENVALPALARRIQELEAGQGDVVDRAERYGNELAPPAPPAPAPPAPAVAALARIRNRCDQLLAERHRHISIGELYRLIGPLAPPATTPEPFDWFTQPVPAPADPLDPLAGAPLLADVAAMHPSLSGDLGLLCSTPGCSQTGGHAGLCDQRAEGAADNREA